MPSGEPQPCGAALLPIHCWFRCRQGPRAKNTKPNLLGWLTHVEVSPVFIIPVSQMEEAEIERRQLTWWKFSRQMAEPRLNPGLGDPAGQRPDPGHTALWLVGTCQEKKPPGCHFPLHPCSPDLAAHENYVHSFCQHRRLGPTQASWILIAGVGAQESISGLWVCSEGPCMRHLCSCQYWEPYPPV